MISLNKFFAITYIATIVSLGVIKAEDTTTEQVSELKQYLNKAKEFVTNIDTEEIKEKLSIAEQCAQKAFTAYPTVNVAAGMFFVGKALTNYQKANNASKYFDKEGTQQLKDTFVRSCNKAGKRNARIGAILLVG